jgi:hypothetical protein
MGKGEGWAAEGGIRNEEFGTRLRADSASSLVPRPEFLIPHSPWSLAPKTAFFCFSFGNFLNWMLRQRVYQTLKL